MVVEVGFTAGLLAVGGQPSINDMLERKKSMLIGVKTN
jgi:hypothetical protein